MHDSKAPHPMILIELEKEMRIAAENLEFERAAHYRDEIRELKRHGDTPQ